jgi:hypothetical protein
MRISISVGPSGPQRLRFTLLAITLVVLVVSPAPAKDSPWITATPQELTPIWTPLEPGAPAEVLLWKLNIDDRSFPRDRRTVEYLRYKILAPAKASETINISRSSLVVDGLPRDRYQIQAQITQPDGTIRPLGAESILSRDAVRVRGDFSRSNVKRTEQYLSFSGAEPGAILEVQITGTESYGDHLSMHTLQIEGIPIRKLEFTFRAGAVSDYQHNFFLLNSAHARLEQDPKKPIFTVIGENIPALVDEPHSGVRSDYALTAFSSYMAYKLGYLSSGGGTRIEKVDAKAGPWVIHASIWRWIEEDQTKPTRKVKAAAVALTEGAVTEEEKARRIHRHVQDLYQQHRVQARSRESMEFQRTPPSLDTVLQPGKEPAPNVGAEDFIFLALSLYRAAGLKAELILLPDRSFARLNPQFVSMAFLQDRAIALQIGETWHFSLPISRVPLPFGRLDWVNQGQSGLLAREQRQDFIDIPLDKPEDTTRSSYGIFKLDAEGTLNGQFRRILTGQIARGLRAALLDQDIENQQKLIRENFAEDLKGAELTVLKIENLTDCEKPLQIDCGLKWPGYAVITENRLVICPSVFRVHAPHPFPSTIRRNRILFPYRWQEMDRVAIQLPPGYRPESMFAPQKHISETLTHEIALSFEESKRTLHLRREARSSLITVPATSYEGLKTWYDTVLANDQHELVFINAAVAAGDTPAPGAASTAP